MAEPNAELDEVVAGILAVAPCPLTLLQIELRVLDLGRRDDTYDVQRSVHRLIALGRAKLTPRFHIVAPNPEV